MTGQTARRLPARSGIVTIVLLTGAACILADAQAPDLPPAGRLHATDVFIKFRLPPLKDRPNLPLAKSAAGLQVINRARLLGVNSRTSILAWEKADQLLSAAEESGSAPKVAPLVFTGSLASELNRVLASSGSASFLLTGSTLKADEPIRLGRRNVTLDLGTTRILSGSGAPYLIRIENTSDVVLTGGEFSSGDSAILVNGSDRVTVKNANIHSLSGNGIVVTRSMQAVIRDNRMTRLGGASVILHGGASSAVVEHNDLTRNVGTSNMTPAILITDREVDLAARPRSIFASDGYWPVPQPLSQRMNPPRNNVVVLNHLAWNAASGIYVDGGLANVIALNLIEGNAKEGICLDNGSTANVVAMNDIVQNGNRWGESDLVMTRESIAPGGRLPNGTPASKVPGVSIDNAAYNVIFNNSVSHNYGGGIKIVRTGYYNAIGLNTILANNDGASQAFHFFGIELGSAALDAPSNELDATGSRGNIVFSNAIRGSHYAGVFFAPGSDMNDVFDNIIMDATNWALESVEPLANSSLNNLTNLPSRNIGAGLLPSFVDAGKRP